MAVSRTELQRIARLSRLALTPPEEERFSRELSAILDAMEKLGDVETTAVPPADLPPVPSTATRPDTPSERNEADAILAQAPDRAGRFIKLKGGVFSQ